jgi:predicted MFS family arabinose efflux permease
LFVVMDAVMVSVGNLLGRVGHLQIIQQFLPLVLALTFASHLQGLVTQNWSYRSCFFTAAAIALLGVPTALLIEEMRQVGASADAETRRIPGHEIPDRAEVLAALRHATRSPGLWAMVGYVFYLILTPGTNTAQTYYSVDVLHCSKQFLGDLGRPGSAGSMLGILAFGAAVRKLPVRAMVWGAYLMDCSVYVVLMGLHDRPSGVVVMFVSSFLGSIYTLCLLTLAARACPPGIEGTVYGLVIAAIGLAGTLGEKLGSSIYDHFGPASQHTTTHGWFALLWLGFGFTVIAVVLIPFLPAWARSKEPLRPREKGPG